MHQDVSDSPELARLAEEVSHTMRPRYLEKDGETLVMVTPVASKKVVGKLRGRRAPTEEDRQAFLSSAGAWVGLVDGEQLKRDLAESRRFTRPPVEL
jgi:hypothetical protein